MLGFQNINQFVFNLSQVTSVLTGSVRVSSTSSVKKKSEIDVFCHESFLNSLSKFKQSENLNLFNDLPNVKFGPKFQDIQWIFAKDVNLNYSTKISGEKNINSFYNTEKNNNLHILTSSLLSWKKLKQFRNKEIKLLLQLENDINKESKNQWTNRFVSGKSFDVNKESSTCCSDLERSFRPGGNILRTSSNIFIIQKRWFRTKRWLEETKSKGFFPKPSKDEINVELNSSTIKSNKYLDLMADEGLSAQEKTNLKVSFAEGYMVAANEYKRGSPYTWQKKLISLAKYFTIITLVVVTFNFLQLIARKTVFPFSLGHHGEVNPEEVGVTFSDVKGVEEVKDELREIVEFLRNPGKFSSMGGKLPRGVLLVGPPGTGKTLLARAVAGEANVPFFHASGSEFDEIFVGEGARRVRNLFKSAKAKSPAIIFIDEIDCVGSKRKNTMMHPYANQTINQLLSEMDGFAKNEGIIVLGATNRKSDLDPALLRPGRFDVEVLVPLPDLKSRQQILELYISKILSKDIQIETIAKATAGCTGADLEAMINHAAIRAASEGASFVTMEHIENAKDKIIMGPERKSAVKKDDANLMTAYHEGGHTLVAYFTEGAGQLNKVTIVPRGESLGHTAVIPEDDFHHVTKAMCLAKMDVVLGGRAAEELIYGVNNITINASDDLEKATELATAMVKKYGMSEKIGLRTLKSSKEDFISVNQFGQTVSDQVDVEVKRIIHESYERAKKILKEHAKEHKILAEALVKYKTLNPEDVRAILGEKSSDKGLIAKAAIN